MPSSGRISSAKPPGRHGRACPRPCWSPRPGRSRPRRPRRAPSRRRARPSPCRSARRPAPPGRRPRRRRGTARRRPGGRNSPAGRRRRGARPVELVADKAEVASARRDVDLPGTGASPSSLAGRNPELALEVLGEDRREDRRHVLHDERGTCRSAPLRPTRTLATARGPPVEAPMRRQRGATGTRGARSGGGATRFGRDEDAARRGRASPRPSRRAPCGSRARS